MKSKKLLRALTIALTTSLLLTGCSMPNLFNKDSGTQEELPPQEMPTAYIQANTGLSFTVGDVVTFNDLAVVDPAVSGNVIQSVIMNADGSVADSYVLDTVGENIIITVAVQYLDGTSETADVLLNVEEPKITFPEALKNNIDNAEWAVNKVPDNNGDDADSFIVSNVVGGDNLYGYVGMSNILDDETGRFTVTRMTPADLQKWESYGVDYMREDPLIASILALDNEFEDAAEEQGVEIKGSFNGISYDDMSEAELAAIDIEEKYMGEYLHSLWSGSSVNVADTYIYGVDGVTYPIQILSYTVDATQYGGESVTYDKYAIVDVGSDKLFITWDSLTSINNMAQDTPEYMDETTTRKLLKDLAEVDSLDAYIELMRKYESMDDLLSITDSYKDIAPMLGHVQVLASEFVIGDVTTLLPKEEPEVLPTPDDTSADTAPESTEEPELKDAINDKQGQYLRDHAGIFKWPENDTVYSRWDYSIDTDTGFVATVTLPNGTVIKSEMGGDWRLEYDPTSGGNGGTTIFKDDEAKVQLVSSYGKYDVSNFTNISRLTVEMDKSTTSRAVITLEGSRYYIETARITNIQSYAKTSLYDTSEFKNGSYSITSSDNVLTTSEGYTITEYNITYTNSKGKEVTYPYMSVININNDYLVCYGDDIVEADETSLFTKILGETVKVSSEE